MKSNLALMIVSFAISLMLSEIALRITGFSYPSFYAYDEITGSKLRPGSEGWYKEEGEAYVRINAQGMRDDREISLAKPDSTYRIAVLGDSYVEALQLPIEQSFWRILESRLNVCSIAPGKHIEVLSFGVSGYSTAQELLTLRHRVWPFNPDAVILAFLSGNDIRDNSPVLAGAYPRPYFSINSDSVQFDAGFRNSRGFRLKSSAPWRWFQSFSDYSKVFQLINQVKNRLAQVTTAPNSASAGEVGLDDKIYLEPSDPVWKSAWSLTERLVQQIYQETQERHVGFLLVGLSNGIQVHPDPVVRAQYAQRIGAADLDYPDRRIQAYTNTRHIPALLLMPKLRDYAVRNQAYIHGLKI